MKIIRKIFFETALLYTRKIAIFIKLNINSKRLVNSLYGYIVIDILCYCIENIINYMS